MERIVALPPFRLIRGAVAPVLAGILLLSGTSAHSQSLGGSASSLDRQNTQAATHDFTYLDTPGQVRNFVDDGYLVPVVSNRDLELHEVSFPYARLEVRVFVERLASQYRSACGEKLIVTSLTRPLSEQPRNASDRSVHPTGMAVDLRRSTRSACRTWLESTLLSLEARGVLEATRERRPPHYHLAIYPRLYATYVVGLTGNPDIFARQAPPPTVSTPSGETKRVVAADVSVELATPVGGLASQENLYHTVSRGESLWTIARAYRVSENAIRAVNGVHGSRILVGEILTIPREGSGEGILQHTVEEGESLSLIANWHRTTVEELRSTNGIRTSQIYPGQTLNVPFSF